MDALIPVINKLQDVFATIGSDSIQLPQIVVVGAQSSGKSSVLEALVGKSFLPRGTGTVTRCPIILQLIYSPLGDREHRSKDNGTLDLEDFGIFLHKPNEIFQDFDEIRMEIEKKTDVMAGSNKGIVNEPINLKIISTTVINLTVVDLPGIVKVPAGDQPEDIEDQIKKLIGKFIENPNSIILAVSPANNDMATSESIKMAKEVDPEGKRTLVIVTKLDLMDKGTDALEMLTGKSGPVKHGIIGVVNRSQLDINQNKTIQNALKDEAKFLSEKYPGIAAKNGTQFLAKTLNKLLMKHIRDCLPNLTERVSKMNGEFSDKLDKLGEEIRPEDKSRMILQIIEKFASSYNATIGGTDRNLRTEKLCGAAQISHIFHEKLRKTLDSINLTSSLPDKDISIAIQNAKGLQPALFIPDCTFESIVKEQVGKLRKPVLRIVEDVHEELKIMINECGSDAVKGEMIRFPKLHRAILGVVTGLLVTRVSVTKLEVNKKVDCELAYINTRHPDFQVELQKIFEELDEKHEDLEEEEEEEHKGLILYNESLYSGGDGLDENTDANEIEKRLRKKEKKDCEIIQDLTKAYLQIVLKIIKDSVPKAIMNFFVNHITTNLLFELLDKINRVEELLAEDEGILQERKEASTMLEALQKADLIIRDIEMH